MDELHLVFRDAHRNQQIAKVIVHIKSIRFRGGQVAKHQLCQAFLLGIVPDAVHILGTGVNFIVGVFGQIGVDQPLIQRQLSAVVGHLEHIVLGWVYISRANFLGAVGKVSHHLLLLGAWRQCHIDGLATH